MPPTDGSWYNLPPREPYGCEGATVSAEEE